MTVWDAIAAVKRLVEHRYTTEVGESARLGTLNTLLVFYEIDCREVCKLLRIVLEPHDLVGPTRTRYALLGRVTKLRAAWLERHGQPRPEPAGREARVVVHPVPRAAGKRGGRRLR